MNPLRFLLLLSLLSPLSPVMGDEHVPAFQYNHQHTGLTTNQGPATPALRWSFQTQGSLTASPIIDPEGTIYLASTDNTLYAIHRDGKERWRYEAEDAIFGTPALAPDQSIVFGDLAGKLYAIRPDGSEKFVYPLNWGKDRRIVTGPTIDPNGQIYLVSWNQELRALNAEGVTQWRTTLSDLLSSPPVLDPHGNLYIAEMDGSQCAIHQFKPHSATKQWTFRIPLDTSQPRLFSAPTIDSHRDTLYVGLCNNQTGGLLALDLLTQTEKWTVSLPKGVMASPALGPEGTVYIGCLGGALEGSNDGMEKTEYGLLYAVDPDTHEILWTFQTEGYCIFSSPSVDGNGIIYMGDSDGILYALSSEGKELWRFTTQANIASSPVVGPDGTLYVTSYDSTLYAIQNPSAARDWRSLE